MILDMRILELLTSKVCHDLVSPVGAINNGVELIEEVGGDTVGEAMKLIAASATQAARRLRLFRMAYGRAGSEAGLSVQDVRAIAMAHFEGSKTELTWPMDVPSHAMVERRGALKVLLNVILMAEECLTYGGSMKVEAGSEGDPNSCRIISSGRQITISPQSHAAMLGELPVMEVSPRTIQPYIAGTFARHFGLDIAWATLGEGVGQFTCSLASVPLDR